MNDILFLSEAKLKQQSDILENVDAKYCRNAILKAQRINCLPVLGSDLYYKIEDLIVSGDITLPANEVYKTLLDNELQQSVIPFATSYLLLSLSYKITQKGVQQNNDELSDPMDIDTVKYLAGKYEETGAYWLNRMTMYCEQFSTTLPEYSNPDTTDDRNIEPDARNNWSSTIYLRGYSPNRWKGNSDEKYYN